MGPSILADWDGLKQDVREICGQPTGELRFGAIPTTLPIVSLLTAPCRTRYPGITHSIYSLSATEIMRRIEAFELDIGITYLENEKQPQFLELPLYRERYVLSTQQPARVTPHNTITWSEAGDICAC